ncbi:MAG: hypothetical protein RL699_1464 [Bacteroidota bacterium]|jgi:hypothetical protein
MKHIRQFYLLSFVFLTLLTSCTKEWKTTATTYYKATSADTSSVYNAAKIKLDITHFEGDDATSKALNKRIFTAVCNSVYTGEQLAEVKNYNDLVNSFVANYTQIKAELKQDSLPSWEAKATAKINYQTPKLLNVTLEYYIFTGGAHGYGATESLLFNPANGKTYKLPEVFTDAHKLTQLVETKFRVQLKIPAKSSLTEAGYFFADDTFVLPKNFIFSDKGIQFHYNTYEVACYAQGPIDVLISYDEVGNLFLLQ